MLSCFELSWLTTLMLSVHPGQALASLCRGDDYVLLPRGGRKLLKTVSMSLDNLLRE